MKITCNCRYCGKEFLKYPSQIAAGRGSYCSRTCRAKDQSIPNISPHWMSRPGEKNPNWKGKGIERPCPVCGKLFTNYATQTCSYACGQVLRKPKVSGDKNEWKASHPPEIIKCPHCEKDFEARKGLKRVFCSKYCAHHGLYRSPMNLWIASVLKEKGYLVEMEKTWEWLHRPGIWQKMYCDIYLPHLDTVIEYDGRQHSQSIAFGAKEAGLLKTQDRDRCKDKLLKQHGIRMIRINGRPKKEEVLGLL